MTVVSSTATMTTGGVPIASSSNCVLTGFRWTDQSSNIGTISTKTNELLENLTSGIPSLSAQQLPSVPSFNTKCGQQAKSRNDEDKDRRNSITIEKGERDEAGRSVFYSSRSSSSTTTSATGIQKKNKKEISVSKRRYCI